MGDIHRDFHAKAKVNRLRSFPFHDQLLVVYREAGPNGPAPPSSPTRAAPGKRIIMNRAS
jgi:hypothetical protein